MPTEQEWTERTKRFLKAELKRHDVTYEDLAQRLTDSGMPETKASIASKIGRGAFPATFFVATLKVIGVENLRVNDL